MVPRYHETDLVVILHQLDDHSDVVAVVLDGDDPHDVGRVLRVRVGAVFVGQHQARVCLVNLERDISEVKYKFYTGYTRLAGLLQKSRLTELAEPESGEK